jgi:DNA polymerase III alpha subunit
MTNFDRIVFRCRLALRIKYQHGIVSQAEPLFEKEINLIRKLGFVDTLVEVVQFGDQLHHRKVAFHIIGSGGSSIILFLLGMSEVDPVRCRTHVERLWLTASGEPPLLQFVVASQTQDHWMQVPCPLCVSVHSMSCLESVPALLEQQLGKINLAKADKSTFLSLQSGDTEGVFQLEPNEVQSLLTQIRPSRIKDIAMVTALDQIGISHPEVVDEFLQMSLTQSDFSLEPTQKHKRDVDSRRPLLYQEMIMNLLRQYAGLPWEETYRFVRAAAKDQMAEQRDLWKPVQQGLETRLGSEGFLFLQKLIAASGWSVCRAHHTANAITSYKAAYFKTHHREDFEMVRQQMMATGQGA